MSWINDNFISRFFMTVIGWFYSLTGNYLIAVILFTIAIKVLLLPLDIKQRQSQAKQQGVSAKVKEIQNRYKHDPRLVQQKVREYYKKENISPAGGCLPLLLQLPLLFAMFGAITLLSNTESIKFVTGLASGQVAMPPAALWVHNIWRPDSGSAPVMHTFNEFATLVKSMNGRIPSEMYLAAQTLIDNGQINQLALTAAKLPAGSYFSGIVNTALATIPAASVTNAVSLNYASAINPVMLAFQGKANGFFVFPVLAAIATFVSSWLQKKQNEKANPTAKQQGGMEYMMPLITLWWTSTAGVPFALYWMTSSALQAASIPLLNLFARDSKETSLSTTDD